MLAPACRAQKALLNPTQPPKTFSENIKQWLQPGYVDDGNNELTFTKNLVIVEIKGACQRTLVVTIVASCGRHIALTECMTLVNI